MPPIVLYGLQNDSQIISGATGSYTALIYILWVVHFVQISLNMRIYEIEYSPEDENKSDKAKASSFDKDDQINLAEQPAAAGAAAAAPTTSELLKENLE